MAVKKKSKREVATASRGANPVASESRGQSEVAVIPVVHEQLQVGKREIVRGKVRLHKTVEEHLETVNLSLQSETVDIVRYPRDELVAQALGSRQEGDTLILPIYEEVLVVEKQLRLVEEIHITTNRTERNEVQQVSLLREKVRLERDGKDMNLPEEQV
jgi:uncharacterized protein (TIGR02271 family)